MWFDGRREGQTTVMKTQSLSYFNIRGDTTTHSMDYNTNREQNKSYLRNNQVQFLVFSLYELSPIEIET